MAKKKAKKSMKKSGVSRASKKEVLVKGAKPKKKLYRTVGEGRIFWGVLAGIAEYLNYDPTLVRLLFILLVLVTGILPGILIYLLAVILVPKQVF